MMEGRSRLLDEIRTIDARDPHVDVGEIEPLQLRTPRAVADLLRDIARAKRISVNALVHVLADVALQELDLPTIADRSPRIAAYLSRTRRRPVPTSATVQPPPRPTHGFRPAALNQAGATRPEPHDPRTD